jgi:parallel beta-helix repeat protein
MSRALRPRAAGEGITIFGTSNARIVSNTISNNTANSSDGGGIYLNNGGTPLLMNNTISGNLATGLFGGTIGGPAASGGGVAMDNSSNPLIVQNLIINNTADLGGGVSFSAGAPGPLLVNNTIAGNTATQSIGSAIFASGYDGPVELFNNLLIGAGGDNAVYCDPFYSPIPAVFENNDVFSAGGTAFGGTCVPSAGRFGNISADPQFANIAANNYRLLSASPAIDAGRNYAPHIPGADFYGKRRIRAGKPGDRATVDMGIAEFQPSGSAIPTPTPSPVAIPTPISRLIRVPQDAAAIQAAIGAASDGYTVQVAPGTYFEAIDFKGKAIRVVSSGGPNATTIDGHALGPVVTFTSHESVSSVLSGFTITGGLSFPTGGGFDIESSSPTIEGNVITGNYGCGGGGIYVFAGSPVIVANTITNNNQMPGCSGSGGAGISIFGTGSARILSNTISNNSWFSGNGGGIWLSFTGSPLIMNNLISNNLATGQQDGPDVIGPSSGGGGIWIDNKSTPLLVQNVIVDNNADIGGGVYFAAPAGTGGPLLVNNTIAGNQTTQDLGSALYAEGYNSATQIINNLFIAGSSQNAVFCGSVPRTFAYNDVFSAGGLSFEGGCSAAATRASNISADPLFEEPAALDYRLLAGSPAIDAGLNSAPDIPATDFYAKNRIAAGKPGDAPIVDMGAAEHQPGAPRITPTPTVTPVPTPSATPTLLPPIIASLPPIISLGESFVISGANFDATSVVNFYISGASGPRYAGPVKPGTLSSSRMTVELAQSATHGDQGEGVVAVQVVSPDQRYAASNVMLTLLQGNPALGLPSLTEINSIPIAADSAQPGFAVANVETVVSQGLPVNLGGSGFDTANGAAVDIFCACPGGKVGPFPIKPGTPGFSNTTISFTVPDAGPNRPSTGPASFRVSNAGGDGLYSNSSASVSVVIGARIHVTSVTQSGSLITVNGSGFAAAGIVPPLTVVNFFNSQGGVVVNLGGLDSSGHAKIPLTIVNDAQLTFGLPAAGAVPGPSYVQAVNPPFVTFSSSGTDPGGSFTLK